MRLDSQFQTIFQLLRVMVTVLQKNMGFVICAALAGHLTLSLVNMGFFKEHSLCFFVLLSIKWKVRFMRSPFCAPLQPISFELISRFLWNSILVTTLNVTSRPYYFVPQLQSFQNGRHSKLGGGCKTCTTQRRATKLGMLIKLQSMKNSQWAHFCEK
jgi:hypothetical protein